MKLGNGLKMVIEETSNEKRKIFSPVVGIEYVEIDRILEYFFGWKCISYSVIEDALVSKTWYGMNLRKFIVGCTAVSRTILSPN